MVDYGRLYTPADPPRSVPLLVRLRLLFGGFHSQFGWLFAGFGMIFVWVFGGADLLVSAVYFRGELDTAPAAVVKVAETNVSINESKVFAYHYTFQAGGQTYTGMTKAFGGEYKQGDQAVVEFPADNPDRSRIQALADKQDATGAYLAMIFVVVGLAFIVAGLRKARKGCRLLRDGRTAVGELLSREPTHTRVNDRTVYKFTFAFEAEDGRRYEATARTHETHRLLGDDARPGDRPRDDARPGDLTRGNDDDDAPRNENAPRNEDAPPVREPLLYNPAAPSDAVLLDALPGEPRIDENGHIRVKSAWKVLLTLIIPAAALIGHTLYARYVLR